MTSERSGLLARVVAACAMHGVLTLVAIAAFTAVAGWYAAERFRMNSNLGALIHQEGGWRADFERFKSAFPMLIDTAMVVVSGRSQQDLEDTTRALEAALRARPDFQDVYAPAADPFFRDHAFLYLADDELDELIDRLARAQPMLTAVAEDPSLRGVLEVVQDGVEYTPGPGFDRIVDLLVESAEAILRGESGRVRWADEIFENDETKYRVVFLKGRQDFGAALPNAAVVAGVRDVVRSTVIPAGITVALTGEVALAHEEIQAAQQGVTLAGSVSLALLAAILIFGIRSARVVTVLFLMLGVGVVLTSAWAMLAVGEFNTLSLVFLAMFFGIGVDFAVHYCLRYEEALAAGTANLVALRRAADEVGGAIVLCAVTTAVGFLGFVPTDYGGLGDLGIISAGGIVVAAALTFTLLPAFFAVFGRPSRIRSVEVTRAEGWVRRLVRARIVILPTLALATLVAAGIASRGHFDYSVLALRDPDSESMRTLRMLNAEAVVTDYSLSVLGHDVNGDASLDAVAALPVVAEVRRPSDFLPRAQEAKLTAIGDLALLLDSALWPVRQATPPADGDRADAVRALAASIESLPEPEGASTARLKTLQSLLDQLQSSGPDALQRFESAVVPDLVEQLDWLRRAIGVSNALSFDDLPEALRVRLKSRDGEYLSQVLPSGDLGRVQNLTRFVEDVRALAPTATGRPAIEWGVGAIVVRSFLEALGFALAAIVLILLVVFRSVRDTALVLVPLVLTATFTVAVQVLLDVPFNMANVLVLPLIFGLGVDNGIHVIDRYRHGADVVRLMHSSTPRAVLISTLTTVSTFAALMLSPHRGTASIGALLTVSMLFLLFFTMVVLPVLLAALRRAPQAA